MSPVLIGLLGLALLLAVILLSVPIAAAMAAVGVLGTLILDANASVFSLFGTATVQALSSQDLIVIPLFILMGGFAIVAGLSTEIYRLAHAWVGHLRGGLALTTVGTSAIFGAICGSSVATTATMVQVALPEMRRRGYSDALIAGSIAGGGTLGSLIPPSVIMVVYAILTQQSVLDLFRAAIIPGIVAVLLYFLAIRLFLLRHPGDGQPLPRASWAERARATGQARLTVLVAGVMLGGIYSGIFTVTEGAAIGVLMVLVTCILRGTLTRENFVQTLIRAAANIAMIYLILIGAEIYKSFLTLSGLPAARLHSLNQGKSPINAPFRDHGSVPALFDRGHRLNLKVLLAPQWLVPLGLLVAAAIIYALPDRLAWPSWMGDADSHAEAPMPSLDEDTALAPSSMQVAADPAVPVALPESASAVGLAESTSMAPASAVAPASVVASEVLTPAVTQPAPLLPSPAPSAVAMAAPTVGVAPVRMVLTDNSWIEVVDASGSKLFSRIARAGEAVELQGLAPFRLRIGNASAVQVSFKGQPVPLTDVTRNNTARVELK